MNNPESQRLFAIIDSFKNFVTITGGIQNDLIDKVEEIIGVKFPEDYREFLTRYGSITIEDTCFFGISHPINEMPSIVWALNNLWEIAPDLPKDIIPIQYFEETRTVVCIRCQSIYSDYEGAEIVKWAIESEPVLENFICEGESFAAYLSQRLMALKYRKIGMKTLEEHVGNFEKEYLSIGKLPRNHIWRPYRFCSQDVVLGLVVVRHSIDNNCLEVDVCMTSDIPEFEDGSGVKVTMSFLLSEAYKCGGSMEIRFSENVEGGRVPAAICDFAKKNNVKLDHVSEGRISPNESKNLYLAITQFSSKLRESIDNLSDAGHLSRERACYVIHHGLWTRPELEHLILGCARVDDLLSGGALPEQRLLYQNDILHARAAIMGGFLDRKLAKKVRSDGDTAIDLEDDITPLEISFDPLYYAKFYSSPDNLLLPWVSTDDDKPLVIDTTKFLLVLLRARDSEDLTINLLDDLTLAKNLKISLGSQSESYIIGCLVPRDFEDLQPDDQKKVKDYANLQGVHILVCPETTVALDNEANRRMVSSRIIRE